MLLGEMRRLISTKLHSRKGVTFISYNKRTFKSWNIPKHVHERRIMWAITCSVRCVFIIPCSSGVGYSRFRWVTILITLFEIMNTFCWNVSMNAGKRFRITWFFVFSIIIFAVCLCMFTCKILLWVNLMVCTDFLTQHNIPW